MARRSTREPAVTSCAAGDPILEWPLSWANVWIDHKGGLHWTRFTHGTTFEQTFQAVYGREVGSVENDWMLRNLGSVGDAEEDDDNPGWQFNELATDHLGWIRVKMCGLDEARPDMTVSVNDAATADGLAAAIRLLKAQPKGLQVEMNLYGTFLPDLARGPALRELRECLEDLLEEPDDDDADQDLSLPAP